MKKAVITILAMALFCAMSVGSASALLVGDLGFTGNYSVENDPLQSPASAFDFNDPGTINFDIVNPFTIADATGDFAIAQGFVADAFSLTYDPFAGPYVLYETETSVANTFFRFTLNSPIIEKLRDVKDLTLSGAGVLEKIVGSTIETGSVVDFAFARWSFSAQPRSFSSNATAVPEPATMILIGTGLVGLVGSRIRRKK